MEASRRFNVQQSGNAGGPLLVLAHGFGCDQNMWRMVRPLLEPMCCVVTFDYIGAGGSDLSAWDAERYSPWSDTPPTWSSSAGNSTCAMPSSSGIR